MKRKNHKTMKKITFYLLIGISTLLMNGCAKSEFLDSDSLLNSSETSSDFAAFDAGRGSSVEVPGNGPNNPSGLITAGEWNDLEEWQFWEDLVETEEYSDKIPYWGFYNNNRISIKLENNNQPVIDAEVSLVRNGVIVWTSKTDNKGTTELWVDLFELHESVDLSRYSLLINGLASPFISPLKWYAQGVNVIEVNDFTGSNERVELSFIVDATGSMADELEFLKNDLADVIQRVENDNPALRIYTSSVFYRDEGDEYLTRKSEFSDNINTTVNFIQNQVAGGGGNFPEAVHSAMKVGIDELEWASTAKTRIAFLLLDAPPHHESLVISDLQNSIIAAAQKGIKVIPITASGIDKETEFLMRFFSITTNGTYVFITNDSGIGNDHLEPTVGEYEVEFLNDLMVRLIKAYSE